MGFFNGRYCRCPVLTQNKRRYLELLPEICLPSLFIDFPTQAGALTDHDLAEIDSFSARIEALYGKHFCVKLPFVTHRTPKYGIGAAGIIRCINEYANQEETCGWYPYLIIQPRYDVIK